MRVDDDDDSSREKGTAFSTVSVVWMVIENTHMYILHIGEAYVHTTHRESSAEASNVLEL